MFRVPSLLKSQQGFYSLEGCANGSLFHPKTKPKSPPPAEQKGSVAYCRNLENTEKY